MKLVFRQTQLYKFLNYCNNNEIALEKNVLDCGAGGNCPPLALFSEYGYKTYGIEFNDSQIEKAKKFSKEHNVELNITKGDIRKLPFEDETISYIYSYNTIFHMKKEDILKAVKEIKRVLKPGGICFINFLTINDENFGQGEKVVHSYYDIEEAEKYFKDMKIIFKENRVLERIFDGENIKQGYVDYIVQK